ncbi:hypothetical protein [uncultured Dialister sp.]|uniref:hypothetical protein n=1 Tax=uncultured Dialister sp. TaxID=278064 RepID=UPI00265D76B7|nr:hypothetical protein [uncultured Dialister sp.]
MKRIRKPEYKRNHPYVSKRDAWNLDDFFSPNLCAGLRRFLTLKLEHIPADFKTEKEWKDTIRQMLWAFEQHHLDLPDDPYSIWYDREERKLTEAGIATYIFDEDPIHPGMIRQLSNLPEMPPKIENAMVKYNIKVQKGNRLFAKYYRDLYTVITPRPAARRKPGEKPARKRMLAKARKEPLISEREAADLVTLFTPLICAGLSRFLTLDLTGCIDVTEGVEGWKENVSAMLWSFEQIRQGYRDSPMENRLDGECRKREDEGLPVTTASEDPNPGGWIAIRFHVPDVPHDVTKAEKEYEEKVQKGLDLFGKYYRDLWD